MILAKTIKGYGLGEAGEGRNTTHQEKKLDADEMRAFRSRFAIPIGDESDQGRAVLSVPRGQRGIPIPHRAPQGARRFAPRAARRRRAARNSAPLRLRKDAQRQRRTRGLDHDGLRRALEPPAQGQTTSATASSRSFPTRRGPSASKGSSPSAASIRARARSTTRSIPARSCTTRRPRTAKSSKRESTKREPCLRSWRRARRIPPSAST